MALNSTWSNINGLKIANVIICNTCGKNTLECKFSNCLICSSNVDVGTNIYNSTECVSDRKYLNDTSNIFTFSGLCKIYEKVEMWHCNKCNHYISIQLMSPSIIRDALHVHVRKIHIDHVCSDLVSGKISIG